MLNLFLALRPRQWLKNFLIFVGPLASGSLFNNFIILIPAYIGFCFASSLGYVLNDWLDKNLDKNHPIKKNRGFASGKLKEFHFWILIIFCLLVVAIISYKISIAYIFMILIYLLVSISYSISLKKQPVIEMVLVALGFIVRVVSGTVVLKILPSGWLLVCTFFGSLFVISGKRISEKINNGKVDTRIVLKKYNLRYLELINTACLGVVLSTYCLWVFDTHNNSYIALFSILTTTFIFLRLAWHISNGNLEEPEKIILSDLVLCINIILIVFLILFISI